MIVTKFRSIPGYDRRTSPPSGLTVAAPVTVVGSATPFLPAPVASSAGRCIA